MSQKVQVLRSLVEQRLTAATEEIFGLFERAIAEHEEEFCRTKEENRRLRQMLDEVLNPNVPKTVSPSDIQVVKVVKEERQEWSPSLVQECPQVPRIKEEEREVLIIQKQPQVLERADTTQITIGEDGRATTQVSQFHQGQTVENTMEISEEDCGGSDPDPDFPSDTENTDNSSDSEDSNKAQKQKRRHQSYLHPKTAPPSARVYEHRKTEPNGEDYGSPKPGSSIKREIQTDSDKTENSSDSEGNDDQKRGKSHSKHHQCSECNKVFSTGQVVKKHKKSAVRRAHHSGSKRDVHKKSQTEKKWYSCPVCRKIFLREFDVQRHMMVHTQEKHSAEQRHNQEPK
ncbi:PR domain zinc finger protein 5-like [Sphaeramia orbicularis]|uniref:PR domain zinc finger protein 5-like n=1 Tax=Sphaeramia orbicularis TaxID=375764 RepID=UPI00117E839D|nr:PR domain zinc finger protein 5-like [Sphaeramia orbicularis]